jgi:hypothetical protein
MLNACISVLHLGDSHSPASSLFLQLLQPTLSLLSQILDFYSQDPALYYSWIVLCELLLPSAINIGWPVGGQKYQAQLLWFTWYKGEGIMICSNLRGSNRFIDSAIVKSEVVEQGVFLNTFFSSKPISFSFPLVLIFLVQLSSLSFLFF